MAVKLCRYCRRFLGAGSRNGICRICWELDDEQPELERRYRELTGQ